MVMVQIISPDEATLRRGKPPVKSFRSHRSLELALLFCLLLIVPYGTYAWDPYEILGVERNANLDQIKSAYRALARKLHPDKSDLSEDDVGVKFIELNKAFNILKDPEKRNRFDRHGEIEDNRSRGFRERDSPRRQARENWTHNGFRTFTFYSSDGSLRRKSITSSQYYNRILRDSSSKIYFIFFYASFCPSCSMIESTWTKITDELAKFNIGSVTINVDHEPRLARDSGVSSIPYIACLVNGELRHYNLPELSLTDTVKFARQSLPSGLIVPLKTEYDQDRFVSSSLQQNRRAVIVINSEETLKLRFHLLAFELAHYYKFGHIDIKSHEHALFMKKFNLKINPQICHILVFDEDLEKPQLLSSQESSVLIDYNKLRKDLTRWPYLKLPKLSTQQRFNDLCVHTIPKDGDKVRPRLCVILFTSPNPSTLTMRNKLIEFIRLNNLEQNERVVFAMIDPSKQAEFVSSLLDETKALYPFSEQEIDSSIILIERHHHDNRKARYLWLKYRWNSENLDELDRAKLSLHHLVQQYKQYPSLLENKVVLRNLVDEEGPGLFSRIVWRLVNSILRLTNYVTQRESFATVMVLFSCALITSLYLYKPLSSMTSGINQEAFETKFQSSPASSDIHANSQHEYNSARDGELKILELRAETYNGMVRLLKPGYRSIILLVDNETRDKLLLYFRKAVWPYRRNKTLLFGYLCLDKNITWYKSLLRQVTGIEDLNVNKKNCIGTVLSLNGFRKYLRVYHAKHHEIDRYDIDIDTDGSFFGTEDDGDDIESCTVTSSISDSRCESLCTVDNLLERLPIWLDKMFDGLTKRYFIDNWPEDIN